MVELGAAPPRVPIVQRPRTWPFQGQDPGSNPGGDATSIPYGFVRRIQGSFQKTAVISIVRVVRSDAPGAVGARWSARMRRGDSGKEPVESSLGGEVVAGSSYVFRVESEARR